MDVRRVTSGRLQIYFPVKKALTLNEVTPLNTYQGFIFSPADVPVSYLDTLRTGDADLRF